MRWERVWDSRETLPDETDGRDKKPYKYSSSLIHKLEFLKPRHERGYCLRVSEFRVVSMFRSERAGPVYVLRPLDTWS